MAGRRNNWGMLAELLQGESPQQSAFPLLYGPSGEVLVAVPVELPNNLFPSIDSQSFDFCADVALPALGTTVPVVQFEVETGLNGIIKRLANVFIGGGFQDGQGGVIWSLKVNTVPVPYYDQILNSLGDVSAPSEVSSIGIHENDLVELDVTNVSITVAGQIIGARLGGWFYPKEKQPEGSIS